MHLAARCSVSLRPLLSYRSNRRRRRHGLKGFWKDRSVLKKKKDIFFLVQINTFVNVNQQNKGVIKLNFL